MEVGDAAAVRLHGAGLRHHAGGVPGWDVYLLDNVTRVEVIRASDGAWALA